LAFNGIFEHTLDAKNRLTVPSRFRAELSGGVFLVQGPDPCISVYPARTYEAITEAALEGLNPMSGQARRLRRLFHAYAMNAELDSAGRVMLTSRHMEHARIDRDVTVIGAGDCLELWARGAWEDYDQELTSQAPELAESLGHPA
jgi:MraZ protein